MTDEATIAVTVVAAVIMIIGLAGVAVPVLPGLLLIWGTAIGYGFIVGFSPMAWAAIGLMTVALIISLITSVLIPRRTTADSGASGWAQLGGLVGAIIGFFAIPVVGIIIGGLLGVLAVELVLKSDWDQAWAATVALAKGFGLSALIDLGLGMVMIATWSAWAATVVF